MAYCIYQNNQMISKKHKSTAFFNKKVTTNITTLLGTCTCSIHVNRLKMGTNISNYILITTVKVIVILREV